MPGQSSSLYQGSPLLPQFDSVQVLRNIKSDLSPSFEHAAAIAVAISPMMDAHSTLLRLDHDTLVSIGMSTDDLKTLTLGFRYPLETIMASAVCRKVPTRAERLELYEQLVNSTHDFTTLRVQEQIATDLNATCNLLKLDPSGALVFRYLKDYPFSKNEFFHLGMEVAAKIFFGLSLELAKDLGDDSWLKNDYSRPSYLPPD